LRLSSLLGKDRVLDVGPIGVVFEPQDHRGDDPAKRQQLPEFVVIIFTIPSVSGAERCGVDS
jgi:hypothetical protein